MIVIYYKDEEGYRDWVRDNSKDGLVVDCHQVAASDQGKLHYAWCEDIKPGKVKKSKNHPQGKVLPRTEDRFKACSPSNDASSKAALLRWFSYVYPKKPPALCGHCIGKKPSK